MNRISRLSTLLLMLALPSCAFMSPPKPYLPDRSGIQEGQTITVKDNENIYAIAREHNVSMRDVIVLNNLKPPFNVRPGQTLELPSGGSGASSFNGDMPIPSSAPLGAVEKNSLPPIEPASVSQETLAPIAPVTPIAAPTPITPPAAATAKPTAITLPPPTVPEAKVVGPQATATQAEPVPALNRPSVPQKQVATTAAPTTATAEAATAMIWPVQGPVLSGFGPKGGGTNNDGVNISAPKGSPVVASAPGTVVYAGNEMKGFGNLVLIRHAGDWVTAYAHLDRVLVKKDTVVGQGDEIGTVGKTGNVSSPQLHFETRHAGKPVDPAGTIKANM
jgi:murein DD-endopeptidase MepM/ murein hydrolase activator NlpD